MSIKANAGAPLASQVGGHPGILTTEDDSLIIKPSLPVERAFYSDVASDARLAALRPHIPTFYGILELQGKDQRGVEAGKESIVLENLTYGFRKPNVVDIKLGTVLYDEFADEAKRTRALASAKRTTSFESGIRFTGLQVYDPLLGAFVTTPKSWGKSIHVSQLPEGIAKFFPADALSDATLLLDVLDGILLQVRQIEVALAATECRMVSTSLLVVWEADEAALREGLTHRESNASLMAGDGDASEGESTDRESTSEAALSPGYAVKLIDFAHARLTPGRGRDESVSTGMGTVLGLLKSRREEIARMTTKSAV